MAKTRKLINQIGLRKGASDGVKKALIRHSIKSAGSLSPKNEPEQLVFEFFKDQSRKEKAS